MKKVTLSFIFLFCLCWQLVWAQEVTMDSVDNYFGIEEGGAELPDGQFSIGLQGGLAGAGIGIGYAVTPGFHLRLNGNYFSYEHQLNTDIDGEPMQLDLVMNLGSAELLADFYPFKGSSFKLVMGAAYNFNTNFSAVGRYDGEGEIFGIGTEVSVTPEDIGELGFNVAYENIAPYAGLGFGRAVPKNRVNFGFELGAYYWGSPNANITGTKMLEGTSSQSAQFEQNLSDYKWYPNMSFRLGIKLGS